MGPHSSIPPEVEEQQGFSINDYKPLLAPFCRLAGFRGEGQAICPDNDIYMIE